MIDALYLEILLVMFAQAIVSLWLSLYIWEHPDRLDTVASPKEFKDPKTTFTVLVPARHEEVVIGETLRSIANLRYPKDLFEVIVVCDDSDVGTIAAAEESKRLHHLSNAKVVTYSGAPINKPHGLNTGLAHAGNDVVVIFDAEDNVNRDILNIANTLFLTRDADIIQAGVQLMNYDSRWFSSHNVLEYYFWFKSRMHFHTKVGMVPLGGNTVFFKTKQLREAGGWDQKCLTEDAEIGIRMSVKGAKIISTYDAQHVTQEETPLTIGQLLKQRTRWNQGFIQVLKLGHWERYDTCFKRWFCVYTLAFPLIQAVQTILMPCMLLYGMLHKLPTALALFSLMPLLILAAQIAVSWVALHEFLTEQRMKIRWRVFPLLAITYVPYQLLLSVGALRATYRHLRRLNNWEKTIHLGAHRTPEAVAVSSEGAA